MKYCNRTCQAKYVRSKKMELVNAGNFDALNMADVSIANLTRRLLIETHGAKCMLCGWDKVNPWTSRSPLELHHKDGDPTNHDLSNVILLCPNCHALTEHCKSRGKGRPWRK
jgi:predicted restriction endonuclease